jgi:SAM-dependent methyltransferase
MIAARRQRKNKAREREVSTAFKDVPQQTFERALELGSGDCYQSAFLKPYTKSLTCSDILFDKLNCQDPSIRYVACDAERIVECFPGETFDLIFSSNMIQHTPRPLAVFDGVKSVLTDDGIAIFVVPNAWWKVVKLSLFYPRLLLGLPARVWRKFRHRKSEAQSYESRYSENNPKLPSERGRLRRLFLPTPIGVSRGNISELMSFRRSVWLRLFDAAGMKVIAVKKGPFISGDVPEWGNSRFTRLGMSTEHIFILKKSAQSIARETYFTSN